MLNNEDLVKLEFNEAKGESFKLFYKENASIRKDQIIGKYINHIGKEVPVISNFYGKIYKIDLHEKTVVIEKCQHEMVLKKLCTACGCEMPKAKTYVSLHNEISFNEKKIQIEEQNLVNKYQENKKLILLLDIDNTILHACNFELTSEEFETLKKCYDWQITTILLPIPGHLKSHPIKQKIFIKFRPYLKEFLEGIKDLYDIYIYTQGTVEYAEAIIDYINYTLEYNYFSKQKLVGRIGMTCENKTIKKIFPTTEEMVVILDDRQDVWQENSDNLINLVAYYFFLDEKHFKLRSRFRTEDDDKVLFSMLKMLVFINKAYYFKLGLSKLKVEKGVSTNVKDIISRKLRSILSNLNITFSSLYPKEVNIYETRNGYLIDQLGGSLYLDYDEDINIVITKEYKSN
jgi:FCP1-like phosphatase family protein